MIISARVIRKPRRTRRCFHCQGHVSGPTLRLYGAADSGDPPYAVYLHLDCTTDPDPKIAKAKQDYHARTQIPQAA